MNLIEAFSKGGFVGLGAYITKDTSESISPATHQAIFGSAKPVPEGLGLGFTDKALITVGVVVISMFALSRVLK